MATHPASSIVIPYIQHGERKCLPVGGGLAEQWKPNKIVAVTRLAAKPVCHITYLLVGLVSLKSNIRSVTGSHSCN